MLGGSYKRRAGDTASTGNYIYYNPVEDENDRLGTKIRIDTTHIVSIGTKSMGDIAEIYTSPTGNCQIQSVSNFYIMLKNYNRDDCLHLLAQGWLASERKSELLIDVTEDFAGRVEEMFKKSEIIFKKSYRNNTGAKMKMYLVQVKIMLKREKLI